MRPIAADPDRYEQVIAGNEQDHAASGHWGVPTFVFENEPFFGQDRIDLLIWRMESKGLTRRADGDSIVTDTVTVYGSVGRETEPEFRRRAESADERHRTARYGDPGFLGVYIDCPWHRPAWRPPSRTSRHDNG